MRKLVAAFIFAVPIAAQAAPIGEAHLQRSLNQCIQTCNVGRSFGFCAETCACMAAETERHWTQEDFDLRASRLTADAQASEIETK